jgi:DNA-binding HxlR family transcriptional regulator
MPDFIYDNKIYYNPVELALRFIGGTYKMPILWRLNQQMMRYGELKKTLPHISHKTLSVQLRQLEADGLIERKIIEKKLIVEDGRELLREETPISHTKREFLR